MAASRSTANGSALVSDLRAAALEIASAGHNGWGNLCAAAADEIARLNAALEETQSARDDYFEVIADGVGQE